MKNVSSIVDDIINFINDEEIPIFYRYLVYTKMRLIIERSKNSNEI